MTSIGFKALFRAGARYLALAALALGFSLAAQPAQAQQVADYWKSAAIIGGSTAAGAYIGHRVAGAPGAAMGAGLGAATGYAIDARRRAANGYAYGDGPGNANTPYGNGPYQNGPYTNGPYQNGPNSRGSSTGPYGNGPYGNGPYGNGPYDNGGYSGPYGNAPYGGGSPYPYPPNLRSSRLVRGH